MIANSQETLMHHNAMCDDERFDRLLRTEVPSVLLEALLMVAHLPWWIAREATIATTWTRHTHGIDRWRWGRSVRSACRSTVVLRSSPAESDSRVSNRITLHLVDGHLGSVSLDKLDEATTLTRRDLDVCYLAKPLEEGSQLILGNITRQSTNEDSGVVRVSELVHRLLTTVLTPHWWVVHRARTAAVAHVVAVRTTGTAGTAGTAGTPGTTVTTVTTVSGMTTTWHTHLHICGATLVLWCGSRDSHGSVAAIDALHLAQGTLLV